MFPMHAHDSRIRPIRQVGGLVFYGERTALSPYFPWGLKTVTYYVLLEKSTYLNTVTY